MLRMVLSMQEVWLRLSASLLAILKCCDLNYIHCDPHVQRKLLRTESSVDKEKRVKPLRSQKEVAN